MGRPKGSKNKVKVTTRKRGTKYKTKVTPAVRKKRLAAPASLVAKADSAGTQALIDALSEFASARRALIGLVTDLKQMFIATYMDTWVRYARNEMDAGRPVNLEAFKYQHPNLTQALPCTDQAMLDAIVDEVEVESLSEVAASAEAANDDALEEAATQAVDAIAGDLAELL